MIRQTLFAILLLALLVQANTESKKKKIPMSMVGQVSQGKLYKDNEYKRYHLINIDSVDKKYLLFSFKTKKPYQGANISVIISKNSSQPALLNCNAEEMSSCFFYKEQINLNDTLLIVVESKSGKQVAYNLRPYWSDLELLKLGSDIKLIFAQNQESRFYRLSLQGMQFQQLRIIVRPQTRRHPFDKVKMYGTFGAESNTSAAQYDFKSFPLWEDSEGIYLQRGEIKDLTMNFILYGATKTVYSISCQLVNKTHGDLRINQKIYEYLQNQERYLYHTNFKDEKGNYLYQNYVLTVATFTGDLDIKFYKDANKKQEFKDLQASSYMGDTQYFFSNKTYLLQTLPDGLYFSIDPAKSYSIFMLEFQGRVKYQTLQLHQNIYQFLPVKHSQLAYIKVKQFKDQTAKNSSFKLIFHEVSFFGNLSIEFRHCNNGLSDCLGLNFTQNSEQIEAQIKQVGRKTTYTLQVPQSIFKDVNIVEQNALIFVILTNQMKQNDSFSAIEYNVGKGLEFLRENKAIQSYIHAKQYKIYKYTCQDPLIKKVRVHINKISGNFDAYSLSRPSNGSELNVQQTKITHPVIQFTERLLQQPIVLIISGVGFANYSILVKPIKNDNSELSYITLSEDVEFKMKIASNKFQVFQIMPISATIYFNYKSTGPLHICLLNQNMVCPQQNITSLQSQGEINIKEFDDRRAYIKVRNPSARTVEVKTIFHSKQQEHCELIKMGHYVSEVLTEGKCLYTVIDTLQGFEVMLVHQEYGEFEYKIMLCSQLINITRNQFNKQRFYIESSLLEEKCKGHAQYTFSFVIGDKKGMADKIQRINVKYIVQYANSIVMIPDGVRYHSIEPTTKVAINKISYSLSNFLDTTIVLKTRSQLAFFAKVVQSSQRQGVSIYSNDTHFSSPADKLYFSDSIRLSILAAQLLEHNCSECELLIFIYSQESVGQYVDFTIQVTQNFEVLQPRLQRSNYLAQNSLAFYSFNMKNQGNVLVQVSDNNQNCAQLYVSQNQFPDQKNFDEKSFDGEVIYQNKKKEPSNLYISVKARQNCVYSVGASLIYGPIKINKLESGVLNPLTLRQGQVRFFTFKHLSFDGFKVLSLHKYGNIQFYLNQTSPQRVGKLLRKSKINFNNFQYKGSQYNQLLLSKYDSYLCKECFYILAAVATKPTQSSILLADEETKIPISQDKVINDVLPYDNSFSTGQFYPMQKGIIQVKIHSGKLKVQLNYKNQSFSNVFEKANSKLTYKFTLNLGESTYGTASIVFKSLSLNTIYSLRIYTDKENLINETGIDQTIVNPTQANQFYLDGVKQTVLKGYLKSKQDRVFISFLTSDREKANSMKITGFLNGQKEEISRETIRNVISIGFTSAQSLSYSKAIPYQLVFSLQKQALNLIAMQTEESSMLPQNVEIVVNGTRIYSIYPEDQFILDILDCKAPAFLSFSTTLIGLQSQKQKGLDVLGIADQTHVVKMDESYSKLFIRVNSPLALIRWLPVNEQKETGSGYRLYKIGTLEYESVLKTIDFSIQPLSKAVQNTKTKIKTVRYNLYVSSSQQDLREASLCDRYLPASVLEFKSIYEETKQSRFKFSIDKKKLDEKYKLAEKLFVAIITDLTLILPDNSSQNYKFVYNWLEIPNQVFTLNAFKSFLVTQNIQLSTFILFVIVALVLVSFLCMILIVPLIKWLKDKILVQENGLQTSKDKGIEIKQESIKHEPRTQRQNMIDQAAPLNEGKIG